MLRTVALSLMLCATAFAQAPIAAPAYRVIVHAGSAFTRVERGFLADAFMKRVSRWPSGAVILPVDLGGESPVRRKFCEEVLRRSLPAVRNYWQQLIFSGRNVPPPELESEQAVIQYVIAHPGAVGYISGTTPAEGVKIVDVR